MATPEGSLNPGELCVGSASTGAPPVVLADAPYAGSARHAISADGQRVVFGANETAGEAAHPYLWDAAGVFRQLSSGGILSPPQISANGNLALYASMDPAIYAYRVSTDETIRQTAFQIPIAYIDNATATADASRIFFVARAAVDPTSVLYTAPTR